jgi:hypothetical protein
MAAKLKHQTQNAAPAENVVSLSKCKAEGCGKKAEKMDFCAEHFDWFKFGLITKEGKRPVDFDKKYQAYQKRRAA